jgi:hypothetical protein
VENLGGFQNTSTFAIWVYFKSTKWKTMRQSTLSKLAIHGWMKTSSIYRYLVRKRGEIFSFSPHFFKASQRVIAMTNDSKNSEKFKQASVHMSLTFSVSEMQSPFDVGSK